jgi:hypothetical protein
MFKIEITILIIAILACNFFLYTFAFVSFKKYFTVFINNLNKKFFVFTFLIGSNPLRLTSSESNVSQTFSTSSSDSGLSQTLVSSSDSGLSETLVSSSGSSLSQTLVSSSGSSLSQSTSATSLTSSNTSVYEGILTPNNFLNVSLEQVEAILTPTLTSDMETLIRVQFTSMDSRTILNSQSYYE